MRCVLLHPVTYFIADIYSGNNSKYNKKTDPVLCNRSGDYCDNKSDPYELTKSRKIPITCSKYKCTDNSDYKTENCQSKEKPVEDCHHVVVRYVLICVYFHISHASLCINGIATDIYNKPLYKFPDYNSAFQYGMYCKRMGYLVSIFKINNGFIDPFCTNL